MVQKFMKNVPMEQFIVTPENIDKKRKEMELGAEMMEKAEMAFFNDYLKQVDIRYDNFTASDGSTIELIIYKPK